MTTKVIAYVRISTKGQSTYSLPRQRELLEQFCRLKNWEIVEIFEEQYSAKTFNRPIFKKAVRKALYSDATKLLVLDWSRFSRNFAESIAKIEELRKRNIEVNAMLQWIHYDQPEHLFLLGVFLAQPDVENRHRSRNTKRAIQLSKESGGWPGKAPIGYKNARDSNGKAYLEIDYKKAAIIKQLFEDFANGDTITEIRTRFKKLGHTYSKSTLYRKLGNSFYIGEVFLKHKDEFIKGLHDGIVPLAVFRRVQERLNDEQKRSKPDKYSLKHTNFPLRGYLRCPISTCQWRLTGSKSMNKQKKYYYYYHCPRCKKTRFKTENIHIEFFKFLDKFTFSSEDIKNLKRIVRPICQKTIDNLNIEIEVQKNKRFQIEIKYFDELVTREVYQRHQDEINKRIYRLVQDIRRLEAIKKDYIFYLDKIMILLNNLSHSYQHSTIENKIKIQQLILEESIVYDGKKIMPITVSKLISFLRNPQKIVNQIEEGAKKSLETTNAIITLFDKLYEFHRKKIDFFEK